VEKLEQVVIGQSSYAINISYIIQK